LKEEEKNDHAVVEEFTEADELKRDKLIEQGWPEWNKKDFFMFIKMAETYGRLPESFEYYRETLPHKTAEQIEEYSQSFWQNYKQIENWSKYIERIQKGE